MIPPSVRLVDDDPDEEDEPTLDDDCICDNEVDRSDSDSDDEVYEALLNSDLRTGDVVWGSYQGTWYPARIASTAEISTTLLSKIRKSKNRDLVPVFWYGENKYSIVNARKIDLLGENRSDAARASISVDILVKYNATIADLNKDKVLMNICF